MPQGHFKAAWSDLQAWNGRPHQPCTVVPINHVITRSPEDRERRREIDRPLERDLELTWQHRFNPSLVLAQAARFP
jgi:hypothetical protein